MTMSCKSFLTSWANTSCAVRTDSVHRHCTSVGALVGLSQRAEAEGARVGGLRHVQPISNCPLVSTSGELTAVMKPLEGGCGG